MFLAQAGAQNLLLERGDISDDYLNAEIDMPITMEQKTKSKRHIAHLRYICHLEKSIYGLHQAGGIWVSLFMIVSFVWFLNNPNKILVPTLIFKVNPLSS